MTVRLKTTATPTSWATNKPWYADLLWPFINMYIVIKQTPNSDTTKAENKQTSSDKSQKDHQAPVPLPEISASNTFNQHCLTMLASFRSFLLAVLIVYPRAFMGDFSSEYPAFGRAQEFQMEWMVRMAIRNVLGTVLIAGFWDWFLYFSPWKAQLHKYKLNQTYPSFRQIEHDAFMTIIASICGTFVEILLCHMYANKTFPRGLLPLLTTTTTPNYSLPTTLLLAFLAKHLREPHFYILHRSMHPWHWKIPHLPDPGAFLYKHVHSLHHKSHNPTAFAGTNMHIVEATLYYTAALVPLLLFGSSTCHPLIPLTTMVDCGVAAWLGHDGFAWPGSGDYFHLLHHEHFDCNYGTPNVPLDGWFGTFVGRKEDLKKVWGGER